MTPFRHPLLPAMLLSGFMSLATLPFAAAEEEIDCRPVVEQLRKNVESAPKHVLTLLEDALIANGGHCVPQFVQTAIEASNADAQTVKQIVFVSITNAQAQAPQIAEAAVAANPKHADSVRAAFAEAFQDNNPRLKPADPADQPAWAQENAPVPAPKPIAAAPAIKTSPAPARQPEPAKAKPVAPAPAPEAGRDQGWELLHDGVVEKSAPIDPTTLAATRTETRPEAPAAVEPELPDMKKKRFYESPGARRRRKDKAAARRKVKTARRREHY